MNDKLHRFFYYISIPLFFVNIWVAFGGFLGYGIAISYNSDAYYIYSALAVLILSLTSIILFITESILIKLNKNVPKLLILITFLLLLTGILTIFILD